MNTNHFKRLRALLRTLIATLAAGAASPSMHDETSALVLPTDPQIRYSGRWNIGSDRARADWPCATVRFHVDGESNQSALAFLWRGIRTRVNLTVWALDGKLTAAHTLVGPSIDSPLGHVQSVDIPLRSGVQLVRAVKLTTAEPFGTGIGGKILDPSVFEFHGLRDLAGARLVAGTAPPRRMEFIGASDTAGYCVDGSPKMSSIETDLRGTRVRCTVFGVDGAVASMQRCMLHATCCMHATCMPHACCMLRVCRIYAACCMYAACWMWPACCPCYACSLRVRCPFGSGLGVRERRSSSGHNVTGP